MAEEKREGKGICEREARLHKTRILSEEQKEKRKQCRRALYRRKKVMQSHASSSKDCTHDYAEQLYSVKKVLYRKQKKPSLLQRYLIWELFIFDMLVEFVMWCIFF